MNFSEQDFISQDEILSDVMMFTGEERLEGVTRGFIYSQMNKCLEELSYDTFFSEVSKSFQLPSDLILQIPAGVFNVRQIYGYNGDKCTALNSSNIYWKRNFYRMPNGYVAKNREHSLGDVFYGGNGFDRRIRATSPSNDIYEGSKSTSLFYYGSHQGSLHFSDQCSKFSNLLIKFNGIWALDTTKPNIPRMFRKVLTDYCTVSVLRSKKVSDQSGRMRLLWSDAVNELDRNGFNGSWYNAENRVKMMDSKSREDINEYLSRLNY